MQFKSDRFHWRGAVVTVIIASVCAAQPVPIKRPGVSAPYPSTAGLPTNDGPGWTQFTPAIDTQVVYVSFTTGDDSFSGLDPQNPKKTLAAAYALLRDGFPDWLLLRRGDAWSESFPEWEKCGRSSSEPMLISSYGTGIRPKLNTGSGHGFLSIAYPLPRAHLALTDIHFFADRYEGTSDGAGVTFLEKWNDVLIENCMIEGYPVNLVIQEVSVGRASNIRVRRNIIVDAYSTTGAHAQGIFAGAVDNLLIEECVFDQNGWRRGIPGAHANIFRHNMYLHESNTGVTTRGNITARAAATGILQRCGGISENNLSLLNPVAIFSGHTEQPGLQPKGAIRNNVILDARDIASDVHRGFGIWLGASRRTDVYGNIIAHQRTGSGNVNAITLEGEMQSVAVYRNIVYDWTVALQVNGTALALDFTMARGVTITDNIFQQPRGGFLVEWVHRPAADLGSMFGRNVYFTHNQPPHQFFYGLEYSTWVSSTDEPWSTYADAGFSNPDRNIESYMAALGMTPTLEAFLAQARLQERTSWDSRFTAAAVNEYIRRGFGVGLATCQADFNGDGQVNVLDLASFQAAVASGNAMADFNLDGVLDLNDQQLFEQITSSNCP